MRAAILTAASKLDGARRRWEMANDDAETPPEAKALFTRMMRPSDK